MAEEERYQLDYTGSQIDTALSKIIGNTLEIGASRVNAGAFAGKVTGNATAEATLTDGQFRNVFISTSEPTSSDGANGDIWIVYDA